MSACRSCASSAATSGSSGATSTVMPMPAWASSPARHRHDRRHDRSQALPFQLRPRKPRKAQVSLGDLRQPVDLSDDRRDQPPRLLAAVDDLVAQQFGVEADRRERIANLVRDVGSHPPNGGEALRTDQAMLALLDRFRHRVELARQIADLVARRDAGSLRIVAAPQAPRVGAQDRQRPQRPQREQQRGTRNRQPRRPQRQRDRQRRLLVIGQPLRDLPALSPQRPPHPVQVVRQHGEVTLELRARLGIDGGRRRPQLAGDAVQLHAERGDLTAPVHEVRQPRRFRLPLEVAVDHPQRVIEVLAAHTQGER